MAGLRPTVAIEIELSGSGAGYTDLRAALDVSRDAGLTIQHGISGGGANDNVASTGAAVFALRNSTKNSGGVLGYYSPRHASCRSGWGLGIGCRIRLQDPTTSTWRTRFIGRIDAIDPTPGQYRERLVAVTAVDFMDELARFKLTPAIGQQVNQTWDAILTAILAQMSTSPAAVSFDVGAESYPYALDTSDVSKQAALSECKKLANSERGFIFQKADGTLRAEGRHARMTTTSSVWTLTANDYQELELPSTRDDILNTVRSTTHSKIVDPTPVHTVYSQANVIAIEAGATKTLIGPYRDPDTGETIGATEIQPLVAGVDYIANAAEDGSGLSLTSSISILVTTGQSGARFDVTNSAGSTAYLTTLQLIGMRVLDRGTATHEATDASSVATHGEHAVEFDMPYQSSADVGQGAADYLLAKFKDPLSQARRIEVLGRTTTLVTQILTRDVSDRITVSETVTGVNDDFYIQGIELTITADGYVKAAYTLTPAEDPFSGVYWLLGTSTLGVDTLPAPF